MYQKSASGWLKHLDFEFLDLLCLQVSFAFAYFVRLGSINPYAVASYRELAAILFFIDLFVMAAFGTYKNVLKKGYYKTLLSAFQSTILVMLLAVLFIFVIKESATYSRIVVALTGVFHFVLCYACRILRSAYLKTKKTDKTSKSVLVISTKDTVEKTIEFLEKNSFGEYFISGIVLEDEALIGKDVCGKKVVASYDTLLDYIITSWTDEVYIDVKNDSSFNWNIVPKLADGGITVHYRLEFLHQDDGFKRMFDKFAGDPVITITQNMTTLGQTIAKRIMDIAGAIVGCILTLIFAIIIGPIIKIASPGPIFFTQNRVGKNGRVFKMYKFRSMYMDAEERKKELMSQNRVSDGMMFKLEWDPRIIGNKTLPDGTKKTGIGEFIRKTSIDEFPQFFNVLIGDMSLVGTRPPTLDEWEKYEIHHRARMSGRPGITGLWQTSGRSEIKDFEEVVRLDRIYQRDWSIGLDIKILLKTVLAVIKRDGAM